MRGITLQLRLIQAALAEAVAFQEVASLEAALAEAAEVLGKCPKRMITE